jgi:hypothetical protein
VAMFVSVPYFKSVQKIKNKANFIIEDQNLVPPIQTPAGKHFVSLGLNNLL